MSAHELTKLSFTQVDSCFNILHFQVYLVNMKLFLACILLMSEFSSIPALNLTEEYYCTQHKSAFNRSGSQLQESTLQDSRQGKHILYCISRSI